MKTLQFPNQKPTSKSVAIARTTLCLLLIGFFAFIYLWGLKIQTESISANYEAKIKELETQNLANQKLAENKQVQLVSRISDLTKQSETATIEGRKSALLEVSEFLNSKITPKVATVEDSKK